MVGRSALPVHRLERSDQSVEMTDNPNRVTLKILSIWPLCHAADILPFRTPENNMNRTGRS